MRTNLKLGPVTMNLLAAAMTAALAGCSTDHVPSTDTKDDAVDTKPARAPRAAERVESDSAASLVEEGQKVLERGGDAEKAKAAFEAALRDTDATADELDMARLGLSEAREALGDKAGAIAAVEELLSSHPDSSRYSASQSAEKRLRELLTGNEEEPTHFSPHETYAPVARALAPYFKADDKGETLIDVYAFGDRGGHADALGIFNIAEAKREITQENCILCDTDVRIGRSISRSSSWTSIPRAMGEQAPDMPQIDRSLVVFYFDLDADRVPARYDEYLPIPSAEIVSHLERGEGLIAMRERKGAKPTIVIAAPRAGQMAAVEDAFAKLTELPKEPLVVPLTSTLTPDEIRSVIRSALGAQRKCYKELLERDPKASGKVVLSFEVQPDGHVHDVKLTDATTLTDPGMGTCVTNVAAALVFPASEKSTKVVYPLAFTPN